MTIVLEHKLLRVHDNVLYRQYSPIFFCNFDNVNFVFQPKRRTIYILNNHSEGKSICILTVKEMEILRKIQFGH